MILEDEKKLLIFSGNANQALAAEIAAYLGTTVGDGAYTAAGSTITKDVPPRALGVGRARQTNIAGWVDKK